MIYGQFLTTLEPYDVIYMVIIFFFSHKKKKKLKNLFIVN